MSRLLAIIMSAVTILALGIVSLSYQAQSLDSGNFTGNDQEAFNLATNVSSDAMVVVGNAMPRLLAVVFLVFVIVLLLMNR